MLFIAMAQALVGAGTQLTPSLGAVMAVRLVGTDAVAGVATSLLGFSRMLVSYPAGAVTDRYGRKAGLAAGLLVAMVGALLASLSMVAMSFPLFVLAIFVFGSGVGVVQQLRVAATDMFPPGRRAEGVGLVLTGSMIGSFGGTGLISAATALSTVWQVDSMALAWVLAPVALLPALLLVLRINPDPKYISANLHRYYPGLAAPAAPTSVTVTPKASLRSYAGDYPKLTAFVCSFFVQGNMTLMMAMTALALDHHGHGLPEISFAVAVHVVGMFGLSLPLGRLADRIGRKPVMLTGVIVGGVSSVVVVAGGDYLLSLLGIWLVGVGWSGVNVAATVLLADTTPSAERGRVIGSNDTFASIAHVSMPLLGGAMAQAFGLPTVGFAVLALSLIPALFLLRLQEPSPGRFPQSSYRPE
jgi:MFS family permease